MGEFKIVVVPTKPSPCFAGDSTRAPDCRRPAGPAIVRIAVESIPADRLSFGWARLSTFRALAGDSSLLCLAVGKVVCMNVAGTPSSKNLLVVGTGTLGSEHLYRVSSRTPELT
jgi:hypothetical protein